MTNNKDHKYLVVFIGDNTTAELHEDKVVDFIEHYAKNSITKKKVRLSANHFLIYHIY